MFPALTTRRSNKRSLSELVRGAVGTALEFATLGEATLGPADTRIPAPRPGPVRGGSPAAPPAPHPTTDDTSATRAPRRHSRPTRAGLPHAGPSPGANAALTAARRPVWEDGSAERPGALPGALVFNASRAAPRGAARVLRSA